MLGSTVFLKNFSEEIDRLPIETSTFLGTSGKAAESEDSREVKARVPVASSNNSHLPQLSLDVLSHHSGLGSLNNELSRVHSLTRNQGSYTTSVAGSSIGSPKVVGQTGVPYGLLEPADAKASAHPYDMIQPNRNEPFIGSGISSQASSRGLASGGNSKPAGGLLPFGFSDHGRPITGAKAGPPGRPSTADTIRKEERIGDRRSILGLKFGSMWSKGRESRHQ